MPYNLFFMEVYSTVMATKPKVSVCVHLYAGVDGGGGRGPGRPDPPFIELTS